MGAPRTHDIDFGLAINGSVSLLSRTGPPVGTDADAATKGCLWIDISNGRLYQKGDTGTGPELWQLVGADTNWRGEVEVRDPGTTVLPTETPASPITVDGESITDQQRVLFPDLTVNPNIHIYDQSAGVFINSTNEETAGDTTFVVRGTDVGKKYVYNGTAWVQNDQASVDEFGFIHSFIGKSGFGAETPTYSSAVIITQNATLEATIGELDAAVAGLSTLTQSSLDAVSGTNVLDTVLVDDLASVKWILTMRQGAVVRASEVLAVHDGIDGGADAAAVDWTRYAKLGLGATPAGFDVDVTLTGSGASQAVNLSVTTTGAADWRAVRIPVTF